MAEGKHAGLIGRPLDRVDGRLKVTGGPPMRTNMLRKEAPPYGVIVSASIGKGRIVAESTRAMHSARPACCSCSRRTMRHPRRLGAQSICRTALRGQSPRSIPTRCFISASLSPSWWPKRSSRPAPPPRRSVSSMIRYRATMTFTPPAPTPRTRVGSMAAWSPTAPSATFNRLSPTQPMQIDANYTTPYQHQAPMEPHATMAGWEGDMLTVHTSAQLTTSPREGLARTLNIPKENVRIITRYVGGGFGSKLPYYVDATLAAIGARALGRPVKVAMTRSQLFHTTTHRSASEQRVRLGADRDGRLTAYGQDALVQCARFDMFTEPVCGAARMLYAAPNRLTRHRRAKLDLPRSDSMRAPGDAIGLLALECAMDELADALSLDPVELRLRNDTQADPERNRPFSSRHLANALREGAARFGWDKRVAKPASVRDGRWLVGLGVASAIRGDVLQNATARARLESDGRLIIELAMTDIGTGSYTILTQIAAETMELPVDRVTVRLGDTRFPPTAGSGGSFGAATSGSAVLAACRKLKAGLASGMVEAEGSVTPAELDSAYSHAGFGAHFAEVGVDRDTGEVRVRRMLGVFAAGRILNAKTARSQMIGGMTWGIGSALLEENHIDLALRLLHQPGSGQLPCRGKRRCRRDGRGVSG